jgi:hypothetical protein
MQSNSRLQHNRRRLVLCKTQGGAPESIAAQFCSAAISVKYQKKNRRVIAFLKHNQSICANT